MFIIPSSNYDNYRQLEGTSYIRVDHLHRISYPSKRYRRLSIIGLSPDFPFSHTSKTYVLLCTLGRFASYLFVFFVPRDLAQITGVCTVRKKSMSMTRSRSRKRLRVTNPPCGRGKMRRYLALTLRVKRLSRTSGSGSVLVAYWRGKPETTKP